MILDNLTLDIAWQLQGIWSGSNSSFAIVLFPDLPPSLRLSARLGTYVKPQVTYS